MKQLTQILTGLLLVLALLPACDKKEGIQSLTAGSIEGERYWNEDLGWEMTIPKEWAVRPEPNEEYAPGKSPEAMELQRKKRLLFLCRAERDCQGSLLAIAQEPQQEKGTKSVESFLDQHISADQERNRQYKVTGYYDKSTEKISGQEFNVLDIKRQNKNKDFQNLKQKIYLANRGPYLLNITLNYENNQDLEMLLKTLRSSKFD